MERRETILFYLLGVVGLVGVSILSTNQIERVEIQPLPTPTPTIVIAPQPTVPAPEISRIDCATVPEGITFGYLPDTVTLTNLAGDTLTISGTVYASDFETPLPDVLIEVWRATPKIGDDDFPSFVLLKQVRTDAAGRYTFTTSKPDRILSYYYYRRGGEFWPIYFHYRLSYQGNCSHSVQLLYADIDYDLSGTPKPRELLIKQVKPGETMLKGSVDMALPISPPIP